MTPWTPRLWESLHENCTISFEKTSIILHCIHTNRNFKTTGQNKSEPKEAGCSQSAVSKHVNRKLSGRTKMWKKNMHNRLREPQPYEDCQAKSIQECVWTSQGMDWGWGQGIKNHNGHKRDFHSASRSPPEGTLSWVLNSIRTSFPTHVPGPDYICTWPALVDYLYSSQTLPHCEVFYCPGVQFWAFLSMPCLPVYYLGLFSLIVIACCLPWFHASPWIQSCLASNVVFAGDWPCLFYHVFNKTANGSSICWSHITEDFANTRSSSAASTNHGIIRPSEPTRCSSPPAGTTNNTDGGSLWMRFGVYVSQLRIRRLVIRARTH